MQILDRRTTKRQSLCRKLCEVSVIVLQDYLIPIGRFIDGVKLRESKFVSAKVIWIVVFHCLYVYNGVLYGLGCFTRSLTEVSDSCRDSFQGFTIFSVVGHELLLKASIFRALPLPSPHERV